MVTAMLVCFVLVLSEGTLGGQPTAFYDLFRVQDGRIAEHWDTIEAIPPRAARWRARQPIASRSAAV